MQLVRTLMIEGSSIHVSEDPDRTASLLLEFALQPHMLGSFEAVFQPGGRGVFAPDFVCAFPVESEPDEWPTPAEVPWFSRMAELWKICRDFPSARLWLEGDELRWLLREALRLRREAGVYDDVPQPPPEAAADEALLAEERDPISEAQRLTLLRINEIFRAQIADAERRRLDPSYPASVFKAILSAVDAAESAVGEPMSGEDTQTFVRSALARVEAEHERFCVEGRDRDGFGSATLIEIESGLRDLFVGSGR
jgi:hypothetical protein